VLSGGRDIRVGHTECAPVRFFDEKLKLIASLVDVFDPMDLSASIKTIEHPGRIDAIDMRVRQFLLPSIVVSLCANARANEIERQACS
jgi:hypothetical protein